jgi:uncharacterized DUF497 family protein
MFEWDENKNHININKHGLSFTEAEDFAWHEAVLIDRSRPEDGEKRYAAIGILNGRLHTVIFTKPDKKRTRIVSFRRANTSEEKAYEENT